MYEEILDAFLTSKQDIAKQILEKSPKKTKTAQTDTAKLPFEVSKVLKQVEEYRAHRAKKSKRTKQDVGTEL
jgi:hypothetical protein